MKIISKILIVLKQVLKRIISLFLFFYLFLLGKKGYQKNSIKTILISCIYPMGFGDLLMDTTAIKGLRRKFPNSKIILITDKDILQRNKSIDEIILLKGSKWGYFKFFLKDSRTYDLIVLLNKNLLQSILVLFLKKKFLIGYFYCWKVSANFKIPFKYEFKSNMHYYKKAFFVVNNLGVKEMYWNMDKIIFEKRHLEKVKRLIDFHNEDRVIIINPCVLLGKSRTWNRRNYINLIRKMIGSNDLKIVINGGPDEVQYNSLFDKNFRFYKNYFNLTGTINLYELAALLSLSDFVITGDTGPMHVAISEKKKVLSLWGSTNPLTRLPLNRINKNLFYIYPNCRLRAANYNMEYEPMGNSIINNIKVDEVYQEAVKILKNE